MTTTLENPLARQDVLWAQPQPRIAASYSNTLVDDITANMQRQRNTTIARSDPQERDNSKSASVMSFVAPSAKDAATAKRPADDKKSRDEELAATVIRSVYIKRIVSSLASIQLSAGTPNASVHANLILNSVRIFNDLRPHDPINKVLSAIYDAMTGQEQWRTITATQYEAVRSLLVRVVERNNISRNLVKSFLIDLINIGLDPLPYHMVETEQD